MSDDSYWSVYERVPARFDLQEWVRYLESRKVFFTLDGKINQFIDEGKEIKHPSFDQLAMEINARRGVSFGLYIYKEFWEPNLNAKENKFLGITCDIVWLNPNVISQNYTFGHSTAPAVDIIVPLFIERFKFLVERGTGIALIMNICRYAYDGWAYSKYYLDLDENEEISPWIDNTWSDFAISEDWRDIGQAIGPLVIGVPNEIAETLDQFSHMNQERFAQCTFLFTQEVAQYFWPSRAKRYLCDGGTWYLDDPDEAQRHQSNS